MQIYGERRYGMLTKIGLDLGYANITLSDAAAEVYREPSIALVYKEPRSDNRRIIAVGNSAAKFVDDKGEGILVRPFKNGILFDQHLTREVIHHAIKSLGEAEKIRCVVGVPSDFLPKQEKELYSMLRDAGVDTVFSVNRAVAALIGAGFSPAMSVISVNVGAVCTEIAVMRKGQVILSSRADVGGEDFDKAVKQYILEQGDVNVSLLVARTIKEKLGAVWKGKPTESIDIEGTLALTGNKLKMNITTEDIVGVFEGVLGKLMMAVVDIVKRIPVESVAEIFENGIVISGGGAELYGLDQLMAKVLGIAVCRANLPIDCVAKGLSRINAFIPLNVKGDKNVTSSVSKFYENSKKGSGKNK